MLSEEPAVSIMEEPIMVDIAPLSRPSSVENLPLTGEIVNEQETGSEDKIVIGKAEEEVTLDFESL